MNTIHLLEDKRYRLRARGASVKCRPSPTDFDNPGEVRKQDPTLTRVLRREPVKWAEWRHVQRVTLRGHVSKVAPTGFEVVPVLVQTSPL